MRDQRVEHYRTALGNLVESLDAMSRIGRWEGPDDVPAPLQQSAAKLLERLSAANRLTTGRLSGPTDIVATLTRCRTAIQRLDAAYVDYRRDTPKGPADHTRAADALELELCSAKALANRKA